MAQQHTQLTDGIDLANERIEDGDELPNPERGCGHLDKGKVYLRGLGGSGNGVLPSFVRCDPPIPFREVGTDGSFTRSYEQIDGLTFQIETSAAGTEYTPLAAGPDADYSQVFDNMVKFGLYQTRMDIPKREVDRHIDRVREHAVETGDHWGEIKTAGTTDLLMRAGESYYPDPESFIEEARHLGISKKIPVSRRQDPPKIAPGITRLWIMHPAAGGDDFGGGIIGYSYLDTPTFTEPDDGSTPSYIQDLEESGAVTTRPVAEEGPVPDILADDDDSPDNMTVDDFGAGNGGEDQ